ncbi:MAG: sugar ABC transporter substrate-binding protein [Gemmatimonadota bacterium]|jgi:simple sugar transport system substrate-binding protein
MTQTRSIFFSLLSILLATCGPGAEDATSSSATEPGAMDRSEFRFVAVTHGVAADPFWSVVANGMEDAGQELGVRVDYQAITTFDMVDMSHLIDASVASRPHGLVVSVPDVDALGPSIRAAVEAGIPVISINSGGHAFQRLGVLAHVGQPEYEGGRQSGQRLVAAGTNHALCVNHEVGNVALDLRCQGLEEAMTGAGGEVSVLAVDLTDPEDARQRVRGALLSDPSLDGILTLATAGAEPTLQALQELGLTGEIPFGTFDLSPRVLESLMEGGMLFALDQQQYLQGYLPILFLTKYLETGTIPGGGATIPTGPRFVTAENAEAVLRLTEEGIR